MPCGSKKKSKTNKPKAKSPSGDTLRLSKSAVEAFKWCPYSFKLKYIDRIKTEPSPAMAVGTRFHNFAESFFADCTGLEVEEWGNLVQEGIPEEEQEMQWFFIDSETTRYRELEQADSVDLFYPLATEMALESKKLKLKGYIDRVDWIDKEKKNLCLVEYKTGKKYSPPDVKRELSLYKMLWDEINPNIGTIEKFLIINPRVKRYEYFKVDGRNIRAAETAIINVRKALDKGEFPKSDNSFKCNICGLCALYDHK